MRGPLFALLAAWPSLGLALELPLKPHSRVHEQVTLAGEQLGSGLALEGDTLFAGRAVFSGPVSVFQRDALGQWRFKQRLEYPDPEGLTDTFGAGMVIDGDLAVIAAAAHGPCVGRVYVYARDSADALWELRQTIIASDARTGDCFGSALGLVAGVLAIGSPQGGPLTPGGGDADGAVYIYGFNSGSGLFEFKQKFVAPRLSAGSSTGTDNFGGSLSLQTGRLLVGASNTHVDGEGRGSAYVYEPDGSGDWQHVATLDVLDDGLGGVGGIVAMHGDFAAIGSGSNGRGSHHVFERDPANGTWARTTTLAPPNGNGSSYRRAVFAADGKLLVSDPMAGLFCIGDGLVDIYARDGISGEWALEDKVLAPYSSCTFDLFADGFGFFLAVDGDTAAFSAQEMQAGAQDDAGSVWIYEWDAPEVDLDIADAVSETVVIRAEEPFTTRFTVRNAGTSTATHPVLTLVLQDDLEIVSMSTECTDFPLGNGGGQRIICEHDELTPGASWQPELRLRAAEPGQLDLFAEVLGDQIDSFRANNTQQLPLTVHAALEREGSSGALAGSTLALALLPALLRRRRAPALPR